MEKKTATCQYESSGKDFERGPPGSVSHQPFSRPGSSTIITTMKNAAVVKMVRTMGGVRILSSRRLGFCIIRPARGGSEQRAIAANVSMITLIHKSCNIV